MPDSVVSLDSVTWDVDPEVYTPMSLVRRGSVHRLLSTTEGQPGGTVYQDRGVDPTDHVITLSGAFYSDATAKSVLALYRQIGQQHTFIDFKGNEFEVVFTPGSEFVCEPIRGSNIGWRYKMSLSVVSVTKWFGVVGGYPAVS